MAEQARGMIEVNQDECKGCGLCVESCPAHGLSLSAELNHYGVHPAQYLAENCTGCGICYFVCPEPGALTVYRRAAPRSEVCDAPTV
jgi:NAD-dependent dihydropyrimidine dehydrogenase PreA subunit